jgi:hypothetical protein
MSDQQVWLLSSACGRARSTSRRLKLRTGACCHRLHLKEEIEDEYDAHS